MKKLKLLLLAGFATFFFTACGSSGGGDSTSPLIVNLIGTWNYDSWTQNSSCDGKLAQGIEVISPLDGDNSKIVEILIQGTTFALDGNQNCYLTSINEISNRAYGYPTSMTADEYLDFVRQANAEDNSIKDIRVDSFNEYKVVIVYEYTNGVIITEQLTR